MISKALVRADELGLNVYTSIMDGDTLSLNGLSWPFVEEKLAPLDPEAKYDIIIRTPKLCKEDEGNIRLSGAKKVSDYVYMVEGADPKKRHGPLSHGWPMALEVEVRRHEPQAT